MPENTNHAVKILSSASSFVEKSIEFRYFLLFSCFILLLDTCLVVFYGKNLLAPISSYSLSNISAGSILFFFALYSFLMSCFFMMLRKLVQLLLIHPYNRWLKPIRSKNRVHSKNYTYPSLLKDKAVIAQDSFTLERINDHEEEQKQIQTNLDIGFGMALLFIYNYFVVDGSVTSLSQVMALYLDVDNGFWINRLVNTVMGAYVILVMFIFLFAINPESDDSQIYSPKSEEEA